MILTLTPRQYRTVRAALRCWLNELGFYSIQELQSHYPELNDEPLTADEVERLIRLLEGRA